MKEKENLKFSVGHHRILLAYLHVFLALSDIVNICYYQTNYYPSDLANYIEALVIVL